MDVINARVYWNLRQAGARITAFWTRRLTILLTLCIALLLAMTVWNARSVTILRDGNERLLHTEQVRLTIARVLQLLTDVETAGRGYALSDNEKFLQPYRVAMPQIDSELSTLASLTQGNATQQQLVARLRDAAQRSVRQSERVLKMTESGDVELARKLIAGSANRSAMDAVRAVAAQMYAEETRLMDIRRGQTQAALRNALISEWIAGGLGVLLLLLIAYNLTHHGMQLRRSSETLATTLRSVGDAVIATDAVGAVQFMNAVAEHLTGWTQSAAHGHPLGAVFQIVNEYSHATVESPVTRVLREGLIVGLANHTVLISRGGIETPIEDSAAPIRDEGELVGVVLVFRDATLARDSQRLLSESEQRFRAAVDAVQGVLWTNSAAGEMRGEQPGWAALTGQSREQYEGFGWADAVHPEDSQPTIDAWLGAVRERRLFLFEHRVHRHDGQWRRYSVRAIPLFDADGGIREWVGVHTDITDMLERERQFVSLANAMPQIVWTERADGTPEYFNRGWNRYTGLTEEECKDIDAWRTVVHPDDVPRVAARWAQSRGIGAPYEIECRLRRHDGEYRWFLVRASADFDAQGEVLHWYGTSTDIDSTKRIEENLRATESALREADRRKDVFLVTLSHELRNPLAPIRNAATVLGTPGLESAAIERSRSIIVRQVRHMASLLDDLLDVSRITRGAFALKREPVQLQSLLSEALQTVRPMMEAKHHVVHTDWPTRPVEINGDPVRIIQIATNLLTNAAKYTDPGGRVTFGARVDGDAVIISVRDTGIGIAPDMLGRIFDMFSQVEPNQDRAEGGLGIGLALVKGLVELHGGQIEARSDGLGRGSEFIVRLPDLRIAVGAATDIAGGAIDLNPLHAVRKVLIADDNLDGAESLAMLLANAGHTVSVANSGAEALQLADRNRPDVAILDIGMPGMNGYEVAKQIRSRAWGVGITLIALTGWGQDDDKRRSQHAGFDHHLTKPVDPDLLAELISLPVDDSRGPGESPQV